MPLPEKPAGIREIFIEDQVGDGEVLWLQVDQALASGARVWVRSPLLDRVLGPLGELRKDKLWLKIQPPGNSRTSEFLRVRDLILAALSLALLAPLMLVLAILVKLSSPGPVFYQTQVAGKDGWLFSWRKFRSMTVAPEKDIMEQRH
ncbi:MAG TPA: sugar transferase, partial [Desulfobaccales bacterium]